jgi:hypothetical protein
LFVLLVLSDPTFNLKTKLFPYPRTESGTGQAGLAAGFTAQAYVSGLAPSLGALQVSPVALNLMQTGICTGVCRLANRGGKDFWSDGVPDLDKIRDTLWNPLGMISWHTFYKGGGTLGTTKSGCLFWRCWCHRS